MKNGVHGVRARRTALADAVSGVAASLLSLWLFYPVDVWKTNAAAGNAPVVWGSIQNWRALYAGWAAKSLHTASSSFCYFYLYSWILSIWKGNRSSNEISTIARLCLSAVAAMANTFLTLPLDVLSSQQQTDRRRTALRYTQDGHELEQQSKQPPSPWRMQNDTPSTDMLITMSEQLETEAEDGTNLPERQPGPNNGCKSEPRKYRTQATRILESSPSNIQEWVTSNFSRHQPFTLREILSLWKGLWPSLLLCSNPAIHFTVFDSAKTHLLNQQSHKSSLSLVEAFILGLLAKLVATIATYPLIRAKIMLMVTNQSNLWPCLRDEYAQHGVGGLYKGCRVQLLHTLLKTAFLMMARERINQSTSRMVLPNMSFSARSTVPPQQ